MTNWMTMHIIGACTSTCTRTVITTQFKIHSFSFTWLVGSYKYFVYSGLACHCADSASVPVFSSTYGQILVSIKRLIHTRGLSHKKTSLALMISICSSVHSTPGLFPEDPGAFAKIANIKIKPMLQAFIFFLHQMYNKAWIFIRFSQKELCVKEIKA